MMTILFIYLTAVVLYLLLASLAAKCYRSPLYYSTGRYNNIAVLIPSYNEDEVILSTAASAVTHNYPAEHFDVFIAADHLSDKTVTALQDLKANVFRMNFERGSKARSLNYLLNTIDSNRYSIALVLDGDNIMLPGVLNCINDAFNNGANCVQVHRTAKNTNNRLALLDAISEEINNELFRKGQRALGLSAALIGSGMAFRFDDLKRFYNKPGILDNPGCDREVDFEVTKAGRTVEYLNDVYVLDEKVSKNKVFENQRRRWMESQLVHLRLFFTESPTKKTRDFWNKLFLNLIPPRVLILALFFLVCILYLLQHLLGLSLFLLRFEYWLILFGLYLLTFLISIPGKFYRMETAAALLYLPVILFTYCKALVGLKPRRKEFVHTPKSFTGEKQ